MFQAIKRKCITELQIVLSMLGKIFRIHCIYEYLNHFYCNEVGFVIKILTLINARKFNLREL